MTKEEFITAVEAEDRFIKWAVEPKLERKNGDVEVWQGIGFLTTTDGTNDSSIWFMVDTGTGETTWMSHNTINKADNKYAKKLKILEDYIEDNFIGGFVTQSRLDNNYAEAEVYTDQGKKTVLIYKPAQGAVTHQEA